MYATHQKNNRTQTFHTVVNTWELSRYFVVSFRFRYAFFVFRKLWNRISVNTFNFIRSLHDFGNAGSTFILVAAASVAAAADAAAAVVNC